MAMFCIAWLGCSSDFFCGLWELLGKFRGKGWSNSHLSRLCFGIFFLKKSLSFYAFFSFLMVLNNHRYNQPFMHSKCPKFSQCQSIVLNVNCRACVVRSNH